MYIEENLVKFLKETESWPKPDYRAALYEAIMKVDASVESESYSKKQGSTCCVVLVTTQYIYCANTGDSRAILVN